MMGTLRTIRNSCNGETFFPPWEKWATARGVRYLGGATNLLQDLSSIFTVLSHLEFSLKAPSRAQNHFSYF